MKHSLITKTALFIAKRIPKEWLSEQAQHPSGFFGKVVMWRLFEHGNTKLLQFMKRQMPVQAGAWVLDIGFGPGQLFGEMIEQIGIGKVCGIDISTTILKKAKKKYAEAIKSGHLELKEGDLAAIPYQRELFDFVFSANTIYFWPEAKKNLKEIHRIIKPGGKFVLGFRSRKQMQELNLDPDIFTLYDPEDVLNLLKDRGFKNVTLHHKEEIDFDSFCATGIK